MTLRFIPPPTHVLIVQAPYHKEIADQMLQAAQEAFKSRHTTYDVMDVPGVLEIPATTGLVNTAASHALPLGNGIRYVEYPDHASGVHEAVNACLRQIAFKRDLANGIPLTEVAESSHQQVIFRRDSKGRTFHLTME